MESTIWFLLIVYVSSVSSEETTASMSLVPYSKPQTPFQFADIIYYKQRECDAIVREAVTKALDGNGPFQQPLPDERYFSCKETLDDQKREFIKSYLEGLGYYQHSFPLVRSNGAHIKLSAPDDTIIPDDKIEFDVHQVLCVTNQLCLELVKLKFTNYADYLNDDDKGVSRCLAFLNDLKKRFIKEKALDEIEIRKQGRGLNLVCTDKQLILAMPKENADTDEPIKFEFQEMKLPENKEDIQHDSFDFLKSLPASQDVPYIIGPDDDSNLDNEEIIETLPSTEPSEPQQQSDADVLRVFPGRNPDLHKIDDTIIALMERDCEELLEWGEQPTELRSKLHLKQLYNECIESLDQAKRSHSTSK